MRIVTIYRHRANVLSLIKIIIVIIIQKIAINIKQIYRSAFAQKS